MRVVLADNLTIQILHDDGSWLYEIDVEQCRNSAETLNWLYQVLHKSWCSPRVIYDIMWTLEQACHRYQHKSVQGALCGTGKDRTIKWPFGGSYVQGTD